jgi:SAM domain (Sterile alpha motif)
VDISAWLRELGLERYTEAFQYDPVGARSFPHRTAEDLTEMGVIAIGRRRLLLKAIGQREASQCLVPPRNSCCGRRWCRRACAPLPRSHPRRELSATIRAFVSRSTDAAPMPR